MSAGPIRPPRLRLVVPGPPPLRWAVVRPVVMGVVNVTPDSFSDGGRYEEPDFGGGPRPHPRRRRCRDRSTSAASRPARRRTRWTRTRSSAGCCRSWPRSARTCASRSTPATPPPLMPPSTRGPRSSTTCRRRCGRSPPSEASAWVAMHMLGDPRTMQDDPTYGDVVAEVRAFLVERAEQAVAGGVDEVWIDPGFGFGKTVAHNLALLAGLDTLVATGFPVLRRVVAQGLPRAAARRVRCRRGPPDAARRRRRARPGRHHPGTEPTTASRARWPRRSGRSSTARPWCGCTTSRATVDAVTLVAA